MVAAVAMVRDEVDIIESTVRQMASQVDFLLIADNRSTDGTREILDELADELPLTVLDDPQKGYYQCHTVTALAQQVAERGAEWILPFDADEWHYSELGRIGDVLRESPERVAVAASYTHVPTGEDDSSEADPVSRMTWRERKPSVLPKVACRALPGLLIHQGNHWAEYGNRADSRCVKGQFAIRHFQYRSAEQFERKVRNADEAYAASALIAPLGFHLRGYGVVLKEEGPEALKRIFYERHWRPDPRAEMIVDGKRMPPLSRDPVRGVANAPEGRAVLRAPE